jgi:uncharacterized membrane protein
LSSFFISTIFVSIFEDKMKSVGVGKRIDKIETNMVKMKSELKDDLLKMETKYGRMEEL